jgi:hypothetical protein
VEVNLSNHYRVGSIALIEDDSLVKALGFEHKSAEKSPL